MANIPLIYDVSMPDVQKFKGTGTFDNNLDNFGNIQLVYSISQSFEGKYNYVKIPLRTFMYNDQKIIDTTNVEFTELQTVQVEEKRNLNDVITEYNNLIEENNILNETVNSLIEKYEDNDDKQMLSAMRDEIINLRIQLGQGTTSTDFATDFPFLPIT
jgi:hypothetical protein